MLLFAIVTISLTLWATWELDQGTKAAKEAGRMRTQAWQLSSVVLAGDAQANVAELVDQFDRSMKLMRQDDAALLLSLDGSVAREYAAVETLWSIQRPLWLQEARPEPALALAAAEVFVEALDGLSHSIEKRVSVLSTAFSLAQAIVLALTIGYAVVLLYRSYVYVVDLLSRLHQGLHHLGSGNFKTRMDIDALDEFGQVAAGFNRMASMLQSMYAELETQVETKTRSFEAQSERLETLYDVTAFLAEAGSAEALASGFAERVRSFVKADAVTLRWSDEASHRYLMLASDCFSQDAAEEERSLQAGTCACGKMPSDARTRVIPIRREHETNPQDCVRMGFETLVSVPVRMQHCLIGEIKLFYRLPTSLKLREAGLLEALASQLANALEGLRAAALEREAAIANERTFIARELHDSIAQSLAFLKIQVQLLRKSANEPKDARVMKTLDELDEGIHESINDVRELMMHFRTRAKTDDIERTLKEALQKFENRTGLKARLNVEGHGLPLPVDVQVQVLHVLQEALSNVRKHAGACHVELDVYKGSHWQFRVHDDGAGFDSLNEPGETHVGLEIMRERAALIGARVDVRSEIGRGTAVNLTLPPHRQSALAP